MKPAMVSKSCRKKKLMKNDDLSATPPHLLQISHRAVKSPDGRQLVRSLSQKLDSKTPLFFP